MICGRKMVGTKLRLVDEGKGGLVLVEHFELHATKGWRKVKRYTAKVSRKTYEGAMPVEKYFIAAGGWKTSRAALGPSDAGRLMLNRQPRPVPVDLLRHGYIRRALRNKALAQLDKNTNFAFYHGEPVNAEVP